MKGDQAISIQAEEAQAMHVLLQLYLTFFCVRSVSRI